MAIYRTGTFVVPAANAAYNLNLGFIPSVFRCYDVTLAAAGAPDATADTARAYWDTALSALSTPVTLLETATGGALTLKSLTTTGISTFQSTDANLFVPQQAPYTNTTGTRAYIGASTLQVIDNGASAITKAANALVTCSEAHSFTSADIGVTTVTFHGVPGMIQINGLSGVIQSVPSATTFTVNINTTNFSTYTNGLTEGTLSGFFNVITGAPASTQYGNQILNTAEANLGFIGLTIGTGVMAATGVTAGDTFFYEAILQSPATGP